MPLNLSTNSIVFGSFIVLAMSFSILAIKLHYKKWILILPVLSVVAFAKSYSFITDFICIDATPWTLLSVIILIFVLALNRSPIEKELAELRQYKENHSINNIDSNQSAEDDVNSVHQEK